MKTKLTVALAAAALAVVPTTAAFADGHDDTAEIVVVHGVPGLEVDVLVNGDAAIEGFTFGETVVTELPAGDHDLAVAAAGTTEPVLELSTSVEAGASYTVAAYLQEGGDPTLEAFANANDATGIQPFHLADFGAVAIIAGGDIALDDVTNGMTARIDVDGGTTVPGVGIGVAGSTDAALDLGDVTVPADTLVLAYAIGPDEGEELPTVVTEAIAVPAAADDAADAADDATDEDAEEVAQPHTVDAGSAGLADQGLPLWVAGLMVLGALGVAAPAVATARRRR